MNGEDDADSFARLVGPVRRLRVDQNVSLERPRPPARPRRLDREPATEGLSPEHSTLGEDRPPGNSYQRNGVQRGVLRKLRRGQYTITGELDLHGLTVREAGVRLARFIDRARGLRFVCVRIIHGKGLSSPGLKSVLKPQVLRWLSDHEAVLAYTAAPDNDGGSGALYALLRGRHD